MEGTDDFPDVTDERDPDLPSYPDACRSEPKAAWGQCRADLQTLLTG